MKLGRIDHISCELDYGDSTIVWIPDQWNKSDFISKVEIAKEKYLNHIKKVNDEYAPVKPSPYNLEYTLKIYSDRYPETMTIGEAKIQIEKERKEWREWQENQAKAKGGILPFLEDEGMVGFWKGLGESDSLHTDINWGHRHGETIGYDRTVINLPYDDTSLDN